MTPRQHLCHVFQQIHGIDRLPFGRFRANQLVLQRHSVVPEGADVGVYSVCIGLNRIENRCVFEHLLEFQLCPVCHPKPPLIAISLQLALAEPLRKFPRCGPNLQLHLEKPVTRCYESLCEIEIVVVLGEDMRNLPVVVIHRNGLMGEAGANRNGSADRRGFCVGQEPLRRMKKRPECRKRTKRNRETKDEQGGEHKRYDKR